MSNPVPKLCFHKSSLRFYIWIDGRRVYLGKGKSADKIPSAVHRKYKRAIAKWAVEEPVTPEILPDDLTILELVDSFLDWAEKEYPESNEADCLELSTRTLCNLFGETAANKFGPLKLIAYQQALVDEGKLTRQGINKRVNHIRRIFNWAVSREVVPFVLAHSLTTVRPLRRGRTSAPEAREIPPVPDEVVKATLPHLSPPIAAMVSVQRLTGMRPGEVCRLTMDQMDRSNPECWIYDPNQHKTAWRGKVRRIVLDKASIEFLQPWLRDDGKPLFSPSERVAALNAEKRTRRRTRVQPSQMSRAKESPRKRAGDAYTPDSYGNCIKKVCETHRIPHWSPNQLRKANGQEVRARFDLSHAQAVLGHSDARTTATHYAREDLKKATRVAEVMAKESIGWRPVTSGTAAPEETD